MPSPLRRARPADLGRIAVLVRAFYEEAGYDLDPSRSVEAAAALAADPGLGRLWLIVEPGVVGYVVVTFGFSLEYHGRDAFVDELFIEPASRRAGLGGRVLEAVEAECRGLGVRALHLEVERGNRAGHALYRRRGFRGNDRQLLSKRLG